MWVDGTACRALQGEHRRQPDARADNKAERAEQTIRVVLLVNLGTLEKASARGATSERLVTLVPRPVFVGTGSCAGSPIAAVFV